jgi:hypothetical protein
MREREREREIEREKEILLYMHRPRSKDQAVKTQREGGHSRHLDIRFPNLQKYKEYIYSV